MLLLALVGGTLLDDGGARAPARRGPYLVLEVDFHAHTRLTDGFLSPFGLVLQARRRGLHALAISDHNMVFPAKLGRWFAERFGGPTILIGQEVTTKRFHLHAIGISEGISPSQPLGKILGEIHRQGGLAIAAHPVRKYWPVLEPWRHKLHGTELMHPIALRPGGGRGQWRWEDLKSFWDRSRKAGHPLAAIGASDYHFFSPLGVCRTLVFAERYDARSIIEAVRARRTVVYDVRGRPLGDPAMIALLRRHPYRLAQQDYNYAGRGFLDVATRTLGLLGFIGLILFRPRRRRRVEEVESS